MKILHIITRLIVGGAQENTLLSCQGQARAGHQVMLAYGPIYGPEGSLLAKAQGGCELHELRFMERAVRPIADWRGYRECRRLIERFKPDIVHTHSSKAGILGRAAAWAAGVPGVVHTIHGLPFHDHQSGLVRRMYIAAERYAARRCHKLVVVADAMRDQALAAGIGRPDQYQTVYSGMDVRSFLEPAVDRGQIRRELGLAEDDFVIGTVARLAELKGHDDLLDGIGPLMAMHRRIRLLWVGDGWLGPRLQKRIAEMGLEGRVIRTGLVEPGRIPALMRAMDCLAHPSYREGLARALPQALLSGLPVISYDVDGAREVCMDGKTGLLIRPGDRAGLWRAALELMENPARAAEMARAGRELCRTRFDADEMVRTLLAIYTNLRGQSKIH